MKSSIISFIIGFALCVFIWVVVPYNNFALNNSFVSDGYLPEIVMLCISVLILLINPLLRKFTPKFSLSHNNLTLICAMLLFATVIPSNGLMRFFPHALVYDTNLINKNTELANAIKNSSLPPVLFPDKIGPGLETPISDGLLESIPEDENIPWSAWAATLFVWSIVIVGLWIMMIGLGSILFPQWRYNERLAFPLLKVYDALLEEPKGNDLVASVFKSKLFWFSCISVILFHSCNGIALFTNENFPKFPLSWDISSVFSTGVWEGAPGFLKKSKIYFLFVGLAYFMPNRFSFSIWFTVLAAGLFVMYTKVYMPTFATEYLYDQGAGALIAIAGGIVWLGRFHFIKVFKSTFSFNNSEENSVNAMAGRLFLLGSLIIFCWFWWAGAGFYWSFVFLFLAVLIMLLVSRIVAETGITYVWIIPLTVTKIISIFPHKWFNISVAFLQEAHYILVNRASAVSVAVMILISHGLNKNPSPKKSKNLMGLGIFVLISGFFICGAVHMKMGHSLDSSYDSVNYPITGRGATQMSIGPANDLVIGKKPVDQTKRVSFMLFGVALGASLLFLCARFPAWPLHPIGLIFVHSSIGLRLVISLFIGWYLKKLVLKYLGGDAYRKAMPFFLGLILGEIFANVIWTLIPVLGLLFGASPAEIEHIIIFQYS